MKQATPSNLITAHVKNYVKHFGKSISRKDIRKYVQNYLSFNDEEDYRKTVRRVYNWLTVQRKDTFMGMRAKNDKNKIEKEERIQHVVAYCKAYNGHISSKFIHEYIRNNFVCKDKQEHQKMYCRFYAWLTVSLADVFEAKRQELYKQQNLDFSTEGSIEQAEVEVKTSKVDSIINNAFNDSLLTDKYKTLKRKITSTEKSISAHEDVLQDLRTQKDKLIEDLQDFEMKFDEYISNCVKQHFNSIV